MKVSIDKAGLSYLQAQRLAVAIARPQPSPEVGSALVFSLPALDIIGGDFTVAPTPDVQAMAASPTYGNWQRVPLQLTSRVFSRADVSGPGIVCSFDGTTITATTQDAIAGELLISNDSPTSNLTFGLVETFTNSADNQNTAAPSLVRPLDADMRWDLSLPSAAWVFTLSDDQAVGTIVPPQLYRPKLMAMARRAVSTVAGRALSVDLSDPALAIAYDMKTHAFVLA
ncbi:hypothetical protein [Aurantimonas sp. VKM B-3413]|uniref:hypothetical protein n=1 Tax=Aurantimonas sp. VKM B-3413 TaxID=2779401 RepID=UPI001E4A1EAA|nr:hypothetical protein [Aurantimonas sp. VKM B-3413]MCB8836508.1 hypothetical protein [Aurantimonas sp. VKM B-3413]